jgi:MFS family permease
VPSCPPGHNFECFGSDPAKLIAEWIQCKVKQADRAHDPDERHNISPLHLARRALTLRNMRRLPLALIAAASIILALSFGTRQSFGLFLTPMTTSQGFSAGVFAFAIALQNLLWGLSQPLFGAIADRFGIFRAVLLGAACYVLGLVIMAYSTSGAGLYFGAGLLVGLGTAGTAFGLVLAAVARTAPPEKRSMALGIASAGGSMGQFAIPLFAQGLIGSLGWFTALLLLAATAALMAPLALWLRPADRVEVPESPQSLGDALREAAAHRGYWLLNGGFFVCGFHVAFIATHLPGYLAGLDFPAMVAAWALATIGLFNVAGSFLAGWLGGLYRKKWLLSGLYFARSLVFAGFLLFPPSVATILLFSAGIGLLWLSTVPLTGGLIGQIFGARYMATLFGIVMLSHQIGAFFGAWAGGLVFDATGSYDIAWTAAIALGVMAAALHLPIADRALRPEPVPA